MTTEATLQKETEHGGTERTRDSFRPNVDILERTDELILAAELPGVKPDDVDIRFDDGELTIHGRLQERDEQVNYLLREYSVGDFYRTFRVSEQVDASQIHAEFHDGVLTLHLPKVEAAKPRKIAVHAS